MGSAATSIPVTTGARIRAARQRLGLTLRAVDQHSGVDWRTVFKYEKGLPPSRRDLRLLAAALKVPPGLLAG